MSATRTAQSWSGARSNGDGAACRRRNEAPPWLVAQRDWPVELPRDWVRFVNDPQTEREEAEICRSIEREGDLWIGQVAASSRGGDEIAEQPARSMASAEGLAGEAGQAGVVFEARRCQ